ncbi:MAG TPA: DUF4282 domain-containing protein [Pseudonocardia sp.]|jgi:hypothetical protein|nr:DUF4282 domain-containing protein [Pseudonocardia sp.]
MTVKKQDEPPSTGLPVPGLPVHPGTLTEQAATVRATLRPNFDYPLTPQLVPALFLGTTVLVAAGAALVIVAAFVANLWLGVLALLLLPPLALGAIALARVVGELALATIQVTEDVAGIAERFPRLESTIDDVASAVPRFTFMRLLAGRERSSAQRPGPN